MINMQSYNPGIILSERSSTMDIIHTWWWVCRSGWVWRESGWFSRSVTLTCCSNNSMNIISIMTQHPWTQNWFKKHRCNFTVYLLFILNYSSIIITARWTQHHLSMSVLLWYIGRSKEYYIPKKRDISVQVSKSSVLHKKLKRIYLPDTINPALLPLHSTRDPFNTGTASTVKMELKLAASSLLGWRTTLVSVAVMFMSHSTGGFPSSFGRKMTELAPQDGMYGINIHARIGESGMLQVNITSSPGQAACLLSSITLEVSVAPTCM